MADPDLELRGGRGGGGGGLDLLALSAIFPSVISSIFTQNKGGGGPGPPGPSPRSATDDVSILLANVVENCCSISAQKTTKQTFSTIC